MSEDISDKLPEGLDEDEYLDFLEELYEEDPLVRDLMDAVAKRHWMEHEVFDGDHESAYELLESLLLMSFVSNAELEYYLSTEKGKQVFEQVKNDFEREEVSDDLQELHRQNAAPVLEEIDSLIEGIRRDLFGDSYEEISALEETDREDREEILERIRDPILEDSANEKEVEELLVLQNTRKMVANFPYSEEDTQSEQIKVNGDEYRIHKHYALKILKPRLYTPLYTFEENFKNFPLRWLNIPIIRPLYDEYKEDNLDESFIVQEVERDGYLDELHSEAEKLPSFRERIDLIQEAIYNYNNGRYASAINLLLPQIEFLLWIYAAYLDSQTEEEIFLNADYDNFWSFNPREHDDLSLRSIHGNEIQNARVRHLVEDTVVRNYLNEEITEYFVEELYEERNPILHGNVADYYSDVEAAKKIVFFKTITERVTKQLRDDVVAEWVERTES